MFSIFGGYDPNKYTNQPVYFGQQPAGTYTRRSSGNPKIGKPSKTSKFAYYDKNAQDPKIAELQQQQQAFQQQLQDTASRTQADIAKQLQIVQSEKSAVSKMMSEYTAQLTAEADRRKKAEEAAQVAAATSAANQARQGQTANLQIQPASSTPKTAGTQPFKRRQLQFNPQTYGAVASTKSGTLNI